MRGGEGPRQKPHQTEQARLAMEQRRAREAEALRENLRKRKQQTRERSEADPPTLTGIEKP